MLVTVCLLQATAAIGQTASGSGEIEQKVVDGVSDNSGKPVSDQTASAGSGQNTAESGQEVENPHSFVVPITYRALETDRDDSICTGTFVGYNTVLTAAHCACGVAGSYRVFIADEGIPKRQFRQGDYLTLDGEPISFNPAGCAGPITPGRDLALLRVFIPSGELPFCGKKRCPSPGNDTVLDLSREIQSTTNLIIVGFGYTETRSIGSKMEGTIRARSLYCLPGDSYLGCEPFAEFILADASRRVDTCNGDSGGPVFFKRNGREQLIAVTSRGVRSPGADGSQCGQGGIYTLLGRKSVRAWLEAHIRKPPCANEPKACGLIVDAQQAPTKQSAVVGEYGALADPYH